MEPSADKLDFPRKRRVPVGWGSICTTIPTRRGLRESGKDTLHKYAYCHARASRGYPYGGTAYANPDAVTQIANGLSTTTFTYDNNGNVTQKTTDGTTTTYVYDYANRLTALGAGGATTTYAYDWAGNRVS